jgi:hypothetical protein
MTRGAALAWLAARLPSRPEALAIHMTRSVAAGPSLALEAASTMADAMAALGVSTLAAVTAGGSEGAELAMDLLAADAFVTYAFEAAGEEDVSVGPLVERLLQEAV